MSTQALRPVVLTRSAPKVTIQPRARLTKAPASEAANQLEALEATDMPWLSKEGQAALDGAPELSGPRAYKKPTRWR